MNNLGNLKNFEQLKISVASPEEVIEWSYGEILKPETINYRTFKPEKDGLMDERIFGPVKDYECACGKYKRVRYKGVVCDKCGVEVTHSKVRRERMGHLSLAASVAHVWFFKGIPSKMATLLDISPRSLEAVIYFSSFIVVEMDPDKKAEAISKLNDSIDKEKAEIKKKYEGLIKKLEAEAGKQKKSVKEKDAKKEKQAIDKMEKKLNKDIAALGEEMVNEVDEKEKFITKIIKKLEQIKVHTVMSDNEYLQLIDHLEEFSEVDIGAEAIEKILRRTDLDEIILKLREKLQASKGTQIGKITKRLKIAEGLKRAKIEPSWMIVKNIPVIPPDLRPMVQLEGGRFATSDLNDLYRRVINRNNRLRKLLDLGAPEIIVRNEKRMLQEAVDSLLDSSRSRRQRTVGGRKELRSLADMLKGKQGRFRANLLGKRVDYSGRSVIVVGPDLKLNECGLPREMALELFKPFVLRELLARGLAPNVKTAKFLLDERDPQVYDILEDIVRDRPVLLNRAPTLHKLGIQAFYPKLIEGNAIQLHPCVCPGYNADFDGDQMAVHIPLSDEARREAAEIMISTKNIRQPSTGVPIAIPDRDMLLGIYYLTSVNTEEKKSEKKYANEDDAYYTYQVGALGLRQLVEVKVNGKFIETTVGRIIFNSSLPDYLRFFNESANKKNDAVRQLIEQTIKISGEEKAVELIDNMKDLGFQYALLSGTSMSVSDIQIPEARDEVIRKADEDVAEIDRNYQMGLITHAERTRLSQEIWVKATNTLSDLVWENLDPNNPIKMMVESGARGNIDQVKQMGGIVGLKSDPSGRIVNLPLKGNYRIGLSTYEYFNSARGARKGYADTALRTADAGYLTRRLVDVAQDVLIREEDCGTNQGIAIKTADNVMIDTLAERITGRVALKDIKVKNKVLVKGGNLIDDIAAAAIEEAGVKEVEVRSTTGCKTKYGVCAKCYGTDLTSGRMVNMGTPVGVIAAQSIGEPGTQLTMRTRHSGGIITTKDITQGLPRVEEIFEARSPKVSAAISTVNGTVRITEDKETEERIITIKPDDKDIEAAEYVVDPVSEVVVEDKQLVTIGTPLTEGYMDLADLLSLVGVKETQDYIVSEIQKVYSSQGVPLNDKHIEIVVRQMFNYLIIDNPGDTKFLPSQVVSRSIFEDENQKIIAEGGDPATGEITLLGITRASLATESWLSAASFMETSRVLTEAATEGKVDPLIGLKENVIIGRMIPVGEEAVLE